MRYEVFPDTDGIDVWRAEAVDHDSEGECYVVIFSGPESERRAKEYAAWMSVREAAGATFGPGIYMPQELADEIVAACARPTIYEVRPGPPEFQTTEPVSSVGFFMPKPRSWGKTDG